MKGELNPADVPSRWMTYSSLDDMVFDALHAKARLDGETVHTPLPVGRVRYRLADRSIFWVDIEVGVTGIHCFTT